MTELENVYRLLLEEVLVPLAMNPLPNTCACRARASRDRPRGDADHPRHRAGPCALLADERRILAPAGGAL